MILADSHCHLDDAKFEDDRDEVFHRARTAGVEHIVSIGTGEALPDLEAGIRMADRFPGVLATVGIHPQFANEATEDHLKALRDNLQHPSVVALGEIGLDYHWQPYDEAKQKWLFVRQMEMAAEAGKPISIHTRDAWPDTVALLQQHWRNAPPCIFHCFTGGLEQALEALELNCYISLAGVLTYPKAGDLREAAALIPADRLLIETDAPYLPPVPYRGKRNEPAYVAHTMAELAKVRGVSQEDLAPLILANFRRVFASAETKQT